MFPWTHAAFGYVLLVLLVFAMGRRVSRAELVAVVVGTQLPDLVDKPLAWGFAALPSGRSLAHSLLLAVPLVAAVVAVAWSRRHVEAGVAFGLGYLSHLIGDTYVAVYYWRTEEFTFLLWPVLPPYPYDEFVDVATLLAGIEPSPALLGAAVLSVLAGLGFLAQFLRAPWWAERPA